MSEVITLPRSLRNLIIPLVLVIGIGFAFVASRQPFYTTVAIIGLSAFIVCLARPTWGLIGVVFLLPFERIGAVDFGGTTIRPSQVLALILIVAWVTRRAWRGTLAWQPQPLFWPLLVFLGVNAISLTHVENFQRGLAVFAFTAFTLMVSIIIPQVLRSEKDVRLVLWALAITTLLVSAFGLFQFLGDLAGLPTSITGLRDLYTKAVLGFPRVQSTALEPLYFANFLLIPLSIFTAFLFSRQRISWLFGLPLILLAGLALVLTVARGGYIGFAASLVVIIIFSWRQFLHPGRILAFGSVAVIIAAIALQLLSSGTNGLSFQQFSSHIGNLFQGASYEERVTTFTTAQQAFQSQPLVGIGPGQFGPYASINPFFEPKEGWKIVNNLTLELLAETGILGLAAIVVAFLLLLGRSVKAWRVAKTPYMRSLLVGSTAAIIGILVQYQTFSIIYIMHVWVAIGLLVAFQNISLKQRT
jgi:putative inorganic carbon (hco3(-)) transporter